MSLPYPFLSNLATALAQDRTQPDSLGNDKAKADFLHHSSGQRVSTDAVILQALHIQYPRKTITTCPLGNSNLLEYAAAGYATATSSPADEHVLESGDKPLVWKMYSPPARRLNGEDGTVNENIIFGKYSYQWEGHDLIVYLVAASEGSYRIPPLQYIVGGTEALATELIKKAGAWRSDLHGEIWVYDLGHWQKDAEMFKSVKKAKWEDVILDADKKKAIQDDAMRFFTGQDKYKKLNVPWKRGVIYYGPPGNGKTISIKALMNQLATLPSPVPSLYVRSLASYGGPQLAAKQVFEQARRVAPCLLIFEDLDSIISDAVRSYFLNEIDGLQSNDGIFMVGSTNHLDQLDPGFARRPSRFDRKYEFAKPTLEERRMYCEYWRGKLRGTEGGVEFPEGLSIKIAEITDDFSFAFMQEAFVASLLAIAAAEASMLVEDFVDISADGDGDGEFEDLVLWLEMKKQVEVLRKEL